MSESESEIIFFITIVILIVLKFLLKCMLIWVKFKYGAVYKHKVGKIMNIDVEYLIALFFGLVIAALLVLIKVL